MPLRHSFIHQWSLSPLHEVHYCLHTFFRKPSLLQQLTLPCVDLLQSGYLSLPYKLLGFLEWLYDGAQKTVHSLNGMKFSNFQEIGQYYYTHTPALLGSKVLHTWLSFVPAGLAEHTCTWLVKYLLSVCLCMSLCMCPHPLHPLPHAQIYVVVKVTVKYMESTLMTLCIISGR